MKNIISIFHQDRKLIAEDAKKLYSNETMINNYVKEYDRNGRKERVLLVDVNCNGSSTGKIVYDLFKFLQNDGRKASICYGRGIFVNEPGIFKFGLDCETVVHAGLARLTGYNGCYSPFSTRRLIKYIDDFKPDLIHLHELHAYFINIRPLINYIKEKRIPLIWTFHCEYMYTGKCGYAYECTNFQKDCGNCPSLKDYPQSIFFDKTKQMLRNKKELLKDLDFEIITPSQWLADRVKISFLKNKEIRVIHNGVDTKVFHPVDTGTLKDELKIPDDYKVVLAVAPNIMSDRKGGKWVLKLAELMKDEKFFFLLVGDCKEKERIKLKNVIYVGKVQDLNQLATFYSLANCFVLFSQKETYSMTCAEALCCGTPIIGFKCGAPESIFDKSGAIFIDYGNITKVMNLLLALKES